MIISMADYKRNQQEPNLVYLANAISPRSYHLRDSCPRLMYSESTLLLDIERVKQLFPKLEVCKYCQKHAD